MRYCTNCGAKLEESDLFCSFCGIEFDDNKELKDKDKKIQELEQKVASLEKQMTVKPNLVDDSNPNKFVFAWMAIPIVGFFVFMIILVWMLKSF